MPLKYVWEGKPTFVRSQVGRSSAGGGTFVGNPWHALAGYDAQGRPAGVCGLYFASGYWTSTRPKADEPIHCGPSQRAASGPRQDV